MSAVAEPKAKATSNAEANKFEYARARGPLTPRHVEFFKEQGFLILEDAFSAAEIDELRRDTVKICRGEAGEVRGAIKDTSEAPQKNLSDEEVIRQYLCIHFPHKISPVMERSISHPAIVDALTKVISPNVKCMQSMLFIKAAGKPGQAWHQDEYYIPTRDRSLCGGWIAMDDATLENGCLWVIPGSHRRGVIWPQRSHYDNRFDCAGEAHQYPFTDADAIPVEVKAGAVVLFNGYLLHRSLPNKAKAGFRRALVHHYMSAESLLPWHAPKQGEGMGTADVRDIIMVAGTDPYAYKGVTNIHEPHVRPSGEGGCGDAKKNLKAGEATG